MEPVIGSARLFAALEHLGQSPGAEMRSPWGPSGAPSEDAQRAFREAMEPPARLDAAGMEGPAVDLPPAQSPSGPEMMDGVSSGQAPSAPGPAEFVPGPQRADASFRIDGVSQSEPPALDRVGGLDGLLDGGGLAPVELYQLQYQVGMLRANLSVVMKTSQSLTQSLETTLKQSG